MNRLDRLCEEADEAWRCTDGDKDALDAALEEFVALNRIRLAVRHYSRGGPVAWYDWCDRCGCIWPHPDQSSWEAGADRPCPKCGGSWDRHLVIDESDPREVEELDDLRLWWRCVDEAGGDRGVALERYLEAGGMYGRERG